MVCVTKLHGVRALPVIKYGTAYDAGISAFLPKLFPLHDGNFGFIIVVQGTAPGVELRGLRG